MDNILTKYRNFWICILLTLAVIGVYYKVCTYDFVNYDDNRYVYENPNIQNGTFKGIRWAFVTGYFDNWHPLTWLSYMLDWQLFEENPAGYHFTNLLLHIINTLLLFIVLMKMTRAAWPSAFVAALFALHPFHVQPVAWVAGRKDVLSTVFWLLTMWAYLKYVERPSLSHYLFTLFVFVLGLMAKSMLVTIPVILLLLDYWPLGERQNKRKLSLLISEKIPFVILSAVSVIVTYFAQASGGAVADFAALGLKYRIYNAAISYAEYILKTFWPVRLAFFYPHPGLDVSVLNAGISIFALLVITILVIRFSKNHRFIATGWFWFLISFVPVIGLIQIGGHAMADRYSYIPLIGLFIIIAWGIPELIKKWKYRTIALWTSSLLVLGALSVCSYIQQGYWKNSITLYEHALEVTENNYRAHFCLADVFFRQGRFDEAIANDKKGLAIMPEDVKAINRMGNSFRMKGEFDQAIDCYKRAIEIDPHYMGTYLNYGIGLTEMGKLDDAIMLYNKSLQIAPENTDLRINLAGVLAQSGRHDDAIKEFQKALEIEPDNFYAAFNISIVLLEQGKADEAFKYFAKSQGINQNSPRSHFYYGQLLAKNGRLDDSISQYEEALKLAPNSAMLMNDLAWYLAAKENIKAHNPERAIKLSQRACELTKFSEPQLLDTLAVAYAAAGDFNKAIEITQKAYELCKSPDDDAAKEEFKKRLELYKAGKPYIEK